MIREEEFSPLKNADTAAKDTPTTARLSVFSLHRQHIERAGGIVVDEESENVICEISPLVSYDGENLEQIVSGKKLKAPIHISSSEEGIESELNFV